MIPFCFGDYAVRQFFYRDWNPDMSQSIAAKLTSLGLLVVFSLSTVTVDACTTAVISGRATQDGRPILWKNRDTTSLHNEVAIFDDGRFRVIAVVTAGKREGVWMGVNEAGFCIENSLSKDLAIDGESIGLANGQFMKLALQTCASVEEFRDLLEKTNKPGRRTTANFGAIDALGGAALFETGPKSYAMFDANDPIVAPNGYIVRTNFATTAHAMEGVPDPESLGNIYSSKRFLHACRRLQPMHNDGVSVRHMLRNLTRDLSDGSGNAIPGTVNGQPDDTVAGGHATLPEFIATDQTISRTSTVSAAVLHGVKPGEDPALTTMWTILGDPKFSIAVPCWVSQAEVADPLTDSRGGELGEIAVSLRDWSLTKDRNAVRTAGLPGIWEDLWPVEDEIVESTLHALTKWRNGKVDPDALTALHIQQASVAMAAMEKELIDMKTAALAAIVPQTPPFGMSRVAIYVRNGSTSKGPENLLRFLTHDNGFQARQVRASDIREGALDKFDALVMPGGSGGAQAKDLQQSGKERIRQFVRGGGGYVGICAGAYLASSHYDWSLHLINAHVWDRAHWARGDGQVSLLMSDAGRTLLVPGREAVDVYYSQGPLLVPGVSDSLPGYQVLATFGSEVARKGAQPGAMRGTHAIIRSKFGRGRVICFSPHPEVKNGPNDLMLHGVQWAAGAERPAAVSSSR